MENHAMEGNQPPKSIAILARALQFRTVSQLPREENDYGEYEQFLSYLKEAFPVFFRTAEVEHINRYSLLCTLRAPEDRRGLLPVLLLAHYDVVPPGREDAWDHPPFSGTLTETSVWGRGAVDDKGCLIAMLAAAEELLQRGEQPRRTVVFALGHDEEIGGGEGAYLIAQTLAERGERFSFVLDEGLTILAPDVFPLVDRDLALIGVSEKGHVDLRLRAAGSPGHSSTPPPTTAGGTIARAVSRIEARPFPARMTTPVEDFLKTIAPYAGGVKQFFLSRPRRFFPLLKPLLQREPKGNAMVRTTGAVTMLAGSEKENVLPAEASAVVNCRILPGETIDSVVRKLKADIANPEVSVEPIPSLMGNNPLPISDRTGEGFHLLTELLAELFPRTLAAPSLVLGTTDSRHYAGLSENIYRFVPFRLTKERLEAVHGYNEHLPREDFTKAVEFYRALLSRL